jgi:hypothetical protein
VDSHVTWTDSQEAGQTRRRSSIPSFLSLQEEYSVDKNLLALALRLLFLGGVFGLFVGVMKYFGGGFYLSKGGEK